MIERTELKKTWDLFVGENGFTEVRILGKFQYSGYFKSFDNLCRQLEPYTEMDDEQIYFVMNKISGDCYARPQCEKFIKSPKATTKDDEIVRRKFLLLDFDPRRRSQTNSSQEQFELAHKKAQDVYTFLKEKGFSDSIVCISGNGWHLLVPVDLPCDEDTNKVVKNFYSYMGSVFSDEKVEFDEKVYTSARLTKLYSTWAKKGANVPSNPWRQSKIVYIPKEIVPTPIEKIKELADLAPKEEPKPVPNRQNSSYSNAPFNLVEWLNEHHISYREKQEGGTTKYQLEECPWQDQHSDGKKWDSALFVDASGKITFTCWHSHCAGRTWHDFRVFYEPDAYNKPQYAPTYSQRPYSTQQPKYEIKEEIPELGEKWMSLSSIKKIDLTGLEKIKTGIIELDKKIGGLYMSEVTVLSGSNASGKSSWLNTLVLNAVQQGYKVALWSGELRSDILKTWIQMVAAGPDNLRQSQYDDGRYYVPDHIGQKIDQWLDGKFFLYNNSYGNKAAQMLHDMEVLSEAGIKLFVLDNLMSLDIDIVNGDKNEKQKELILKIKEFAKTHNIHIILVAHPRKTMAFLRKNDISGTADITNAVDNVVIFHRVNNDFIKSGGEFYGERDIQAFSKYGNCIEVCKNRLFGIADVMFGLHYDIPSRRFKNTTEENIHYGWEEQPTQATLPMPEPEPEAHHPVSDEEWPF